MGKAVTRKEAEQILENALEIGARMLISGAEISRVEDSILESARLMDLNGLRCFLLRIQLLPLFPPRISVS